MKNSKFMKATAMLFTRIEKARLKVRYTFGMPPHRAEGDIIDLGEFQIEMRKFTPHQDE